MILQAKDLCVGYDNKEVLKDVSIYINKGEIVTIVGPNGSGKSTLLKTLSRTLKPKHGQILLENRNIYTMKTKALAQKLAILPQTRHSPSDFTVEELVGYGRFPHMSFGKMLQKQDYDIIDWSLDKTDMTELRYRFVRSLSGGERQRAWIAMALAQKPEILLLDEPTTFLDISYQLEILQLIKELNENLGLTIVMVLHDLNQAVRYSNRIYALKEGRVYSHGDGKQLLNAEFLKEVFRIKGEILRDNANQCNYFIPQRSIKNNL